MPPDARPYRYVLDEDVKIIHEAYLAKRAERFSLLEPSNPAQTVTPWEEGSIFPKCEDGHDPVELVFPDDCQSCYGGDAYGDCGPFCPVCSYCCGC